MPHVHETSPAPAVALPPDRPVDVVLRDGRVVRIAQYGDPDGEPVLWFHGAGSSRLEGALLHAAAVARGLRVLAPDRPGVGGSDQHPARTVVGYAEDVAELLDLLDVGQVRIGGLSNGGMYAIAVAHGLRDRVVQVVPVNPAVPVADPAVRASLSLSTRMAYDFLGRHPERAITGLVSPSSPGLLVRLLRGLSRNPDAAAMGEPGAVAMTSALRAEAVRQPDRSGLLDEIRLGPGGWGFDHRSITAPVAFLVGVEDRSLAYVRTWARELSRGRIVEVAGGHMNLFRPSVADRACQLLTGAP